MQIILYDMSTILKHYIKNITTDSRLQYSDISTTDSGLQYSDISTTDSGLQYSDISNLH